MQFELNLVLGQQFFPLQTHLNSAEFKPTTACIRITLPHKVTFSIHSGLNKLTTVKITFLLSDKSINRRSNWQQQVFYPSKNVLISRHPSTKEALSSQPFDWQLILAERSVYARPRAHNSQWVIVQTCDPLSLLSPLCESLTRQPPADWCIM